jgi:flagellar hook-associated protein 2
MATGISFSGLSSGLDTDSIVTALVQAESGAKTTLQAKQNKLKLRQTAYTTIGSGLSTVARAAGNLNSAGAFATIKASSTDETISTISATSSATAGAFDLTVTKLAKANKIGSAAQIDTTTALGKAGTASVNGKAFKIEAADSLVAIAKKVNALGSGVTASVVDGGSGRGYLTFSSGTTGTASAVSIADLDGTAMADLGMKGAGTTVRQTVGTAAVGRTFSSKTDSLQTILGTTGLSTSTVTIGGTPISVDPATDTLETLAGKINAAAITGVTATVQADTSGGATVYKLQISGSGAPPAMSETGGVLGSLGILRDNPASELVAAQDAQYTLDGVALTSATNSVTGAVGGATLTLKKEGAASISLVKDTSAITASVENLVTAVNGLLSTIKGQSGFDAKTFQSGVLFGDSVARSAKDSVKALLFSDSPGVTGSIKNLASVGIGLDETGSVTMDDSVFQAALAKDPDGIAALFQAVGKGSTNDIKYVSATNAAVASSTSGYAVNVTQPATKASLVAGTAQTGPRTGPETLTFRGSGFGTAGVAVDFEAGTDLAATIAKINGDGRLKDLVSASNEGGKLRIDSKRYGVAGNFTVASNFGSAIDNSGIGIGGEGTAVLGLDIAGTINGEAATGNGQFLTGKTGNAKTDGLQLQVLSTTPGLIGTITYSRGAASRMLDLSSTFTDTIKGSLSAADKSLQAQIDSIDKDLTTIDARIASKTTELKNRFAAMETALAKLKDQASTISSMLGTSSTSS